MDAWAHVHENILHAIFAILDIRQAARCALVCRGWRDAVRRAPTLDLSAERDKVARSAVHWLAWNGFGGSNLATIRIPRAVFVPAVEALDLSIVCNNLKTSALSMWADSVAEVHIAMQAAAVLPGPLLLKVSDDSRRRRSALTAFCARHTPKPPSLRHLRLSAPMVNVEEPAMADFAAWLTSPECAIESLYTEYGDGAWVNLLADIVHANRSLTALAVSDLKADDAVAARFVHELSHNERITDISIDNSFDEQECPGFAAHFARLIANTTTIRKLALTGGTITESTAPTFCAGIAANRTLVEVDLSHNWVGDVVEDRMTLDLCEAVKQNASIERLCLVCMISDDDGAKRVATILRDAPVLRALEVKESWNFKTRGFDALRESVRELTVVTDEF